MLEISGKNKGNRKSYVALELKASSKYQIHDNLLFPRNVRKTFPIVKYCSLKTLLLSTQLCRAGCPSEGSTVYTNAHESAKSALSTFPVPPTNPNHKVFEQNRSEPTEGRRSKSKSFNPETLFYYAKQQNFKVYFGSQILLIFYFRLRIIYSSSFLEQLQTAKHETSSKRIILPHSSYDCHSQCFELNTYIINIIAVEQK